MSYCVYVILRITVLCSTYKILALSKRPAKISNNLVNF